MLILGIVLFALPFLAWYIVGVRWFGWLAPTFLYLMLISLGVGLGLIIWGLK
jgi:hypothetical protein